MIKSVSKQKPLHEKEADLLKQVIQYLKFAGIWFKRVQVGPTPRSRNGITVFTPSTMTGMPDIIACIHGRLCAMELKSQRGKLSEAQEKTLNEMALAGAKVIVAHSLDEIIEFIRQAKQER